MQPKDTEVLIAGAGIGGLTAGIALAEHGVPVRIFEQAEELGEVGAGLTLAPNAVKVFEHLGLGPALAEISFEPLTQGIRHYKTGEVVVARPRGPAVWDTYGTHYYHVHRADLHDLLSAEMRRRAPDSIVTGHRATGFEDAGDSVTLRFANGASASGDILLGADGVRSAVRNQLFGDTTVRFTGHVAWRGMIPVERIGGMELDPPSCTFIGPQRLVARYYVRGRSMVNIVALARRGGWEVEDWMAKSSPQEPLDEFAGWHEEVLTLLRAVPEDQMFKWALFARDPLTEWSVGRVSLLGDAAHPMLPFMGQGASMAVEDGLVLARALVAGLAEGQSPAQALKRYEMLRIERASMVQLESTIQAERYQGGEPEDYLATPRENEESMGLFHYDAGTVAV